MGALFVLTGALAGAKDAAGPPVIAWQPWSDSVFAQAKREPKFVLLDPGSLAPEMRAHSEAGLSKAIEGKRAPGE